MAYDTMSRRVPKRRNGALHRFGVRPGARVWWRILHHVWVCPDRNIEVLHHFGTPLALCTAERRSVTPFPGMPRNSVGFRTPNSVMVYYFIVVPTIMTRFYLFMLGSLFAVPR